MAARALPGQHGRLRGFHRINLRLRVARLDRFAHAGQRATGAEAGYETADWPGHLAQNLLAGSVFVVGYVQRILKLARQEIARILRRHFARHLDPGLVTACAREQDEFGTQLLNQLPPFLTCAFGHQDCDAATQRRADHGQRDAGVAAAAFENDRIGLQQAVLFSVEHHFPGKPILDAAARIQEFALGPDRDVLWLKVNRHRRRVADQAQHGRVNARDWCRDGLLRGRRRAAAHGQCGPRSAARFAP